MDIKQSTEAIRAQLHVTEKGEISDNAITINYRLGVKQMHFLASPRQFLSVMKAYGFIERYEPAVVGWWVSDKSFTQQLEDYLRQMTIESWKNFLVIFEFRKSLREAHSEATEAKNAHSKIG